MAETSSSRNRRLARFARIYDSAVLGALGGLLGWMLFVELLPQDLPWWVAALVGGMLIGASLGGSLAGAEALRDRSLFRWTRCAAVGILLGSAGGARWFLAR